MDVTAARHAPLLLFYFRSVADRRGFLRIVDGLVMLVVVFIGVVAVV